MADHIDDAGLSQLGLPDDLAAVRMNVAVQEQARMHPLDRPAYRPKPAVRRVRTFVGTGRRAMGDQDIQPAAAQSKSQGNHSGHYLPLRVLILSVAVADTAFPPGDRPPPL